MVYETDTSSSSSPPRCSSHGKCWCRSEHRYRGAGGATSGYRCPCARLCPVGPGLRGRPRTRLRASSVCGASAGSGVCGSTSAPCGLLPGASSRYRRSAGSMQATDGADRVWLRTPSSSPPRRLGAVPVRLGWGFLQRVRQQAGILGSRPASVSARCSLSSRAYFRTTS